MGAINSKKLNFIEKAMMKALKAPVGDFRDWKKIEEWAAGIAKELKK